MATAIGGTGSNNVTISRVRVVTTTTAISHGGDNWVIDDVSANIVSNFLASTAGHSFLTIANCFTAGLIDVSDCDWVSIVGNHLRSLIELGAASSVTIEANTVDSPGGSGAELVRGDGCRGVVITANNYTEGDGFDAMTLANTSGFSVSGNLFGNITAGLAFTSCSLGQVRGNILGGQGSVGSAYLGETGIAAADCADLQIQDNRILEPGQDSDDTYDGIALTGTTEGVYVEGNKVTPSAQANSTRYGISDATDLCNIAVGNDLEDDTAYGTAAMLVGAQTQVTYPNDAQWGDNFTACSPSSPTSPTSP